MSGEEQSPSDNGREDESSPDKDSNANAHIAPDLIDEELPTAAEMKAVEETTEPKSAILLHVSNLTRYCLPSFSSYCF
jgi:hypothetical protein